MPGDDGTLKKSTGSRQDNGSGYESALKDTIRTLEQMRSESEAKINNVAKTLAENFRNSRIGWEKEIQTLSLKDAKELNRVREELAEDLLAQQKRNGMSNQTFQKKLESQLYNYKLQLDARARVEAKRHEIEFSKTRIQIARDTINEIRRLEKDDRISKYRAELENLEELKKKRAQLVVAGRSTKGIDRRIAAAERRTKKAQDSITEAEENRRGPSALSVAIKELTSTFKDPKGVNLGEVLRSLGRSAGQTMNAATGMSDVFGVFSGRTSREALKERVQAGDEQAAAAEANLDRLEEKMNSFVNGINQLLQSYIDEYTGYQAKVNARLQGSGLTWNNDGIGDTLTNAVGSNPYVKLSKLLENASVAVENGIAYNVEQRAFLESIKEDIATTFDAFNSNLLRLVRLQQNDSTAARMGLEATLTQVFNSYFSDTSYLSDAFDSVSESLTEAIAQMGTEQGVEFEYAVQKWLGSLYSVGFSSGSISGIAKALGQLGSGDVSGLAGNSQMQNLIVMAASRAGLSYADMLTGGLTAQDTNTLLQSMVGYLQEIAQSDNKVIKSQFSQVYGLTASDLIAAQNLGDTVSKLSNETLNYAEAIDELYNQMNQLPSRLSIGEMVGNMIDNVKYTLAQGIGDNPVNYALWEITDMIEGLSGGIQIPKISVMGNSFDLKTSVTNLMRLGIAGASLLGNIGTIVSGVGSTFAPSSILDKLGVSRESNASQITRGSGLGRKQRLSQQVSSSNYVGNESGEDYQASVMAQANAQGQEALNQKKEEEQTKSINDIHEYLLQVFDPKVTAITSMLAGLTGTTLSTSN